MEWAWKPRGLSPVAKLTLLALARYADIGGSAWPGVATLCADTELSTSQIADGLRTLEQLDLIHRTANRQGGFHFSLLIDAYCIEMAKSYGYRPAAKPEVLS